MITFTKNVRFIGLEIMKFRDGKDGYKATLMVDGDVVEVYPSGSSKHLNDFIGAEMGDQLEIEFLVRSRQGGGYRLGCK